MSSSASSPSFCFGGEPDRDWHARIADAVGPDESWGPDAARHADRPDPDLPEAQLA